MSFVIVTRLSLVQCRVKAGCGEVCACLLKCLCVGKPCVHPFSQKCLPRFNPPCPLTFKGIVPMMKYRTAFHTTVYMLSVRSLSQHTRVFQSELPSPAKMFLVFGVISAVEELAAHHFKI